MNRQQQELALQQTATALAQQQAAFAAELTERQISSVYWQPIVLLFPWLAALTLAGLALALLVRLGRWALNGHQEQVQILHLTSAAATAQEWARSQRLVLPHHLHYSPSYDDRCPPPVLPAERSEPALPTERSEPALPGACDLLSIQHTPSVQQILLGLAPGGVPVTVPVGKLCHVGIVGSTGSGKSNLLRLILPQLQAVGARVVLCDPHYAPVDPVSGEDWRPIAQRLYQPPAYTTDAIGEVLHWLLDELDTRLEQRRQQQPFGPPLFLALDELPVIADTVPGSMAALGRLLKEGRKVWLYVVGAAQSMLVKAIGGDSAARDNYRTAYYVGGDLLSAHAAREQPGAGGVVGGCPGMAEATS